MGAHNEWGTQRLAHAWGASTHVRMQTCCNVSAFRHGRDIKSEIMYMVGILNQNNVAVVSQWWLFPIM